MVGVGRSPGVASNAPSTPSPSPLAVAGSAASTLVPATPTAGPTATAEPTPEPTPKPTPEPTPAPVPAMDFKQIKLSGRGDKVVRFKIPEDAAAMASFSHGGSGNFAVWTLDSSGDETDLLVNEIGKYSGRVLFDEDGHSVAFKITASGKWSVNINPVQRIPKWDGSEPRTGKSDDVVWITADTSGLATLKLSHRGDGNFAIWAYATDGRELLVNEVGRYSGEVLLGDAFLLEILADGTWSMALAD
jgi:hypothetical protein